MPPHDRTLHPHAAGDNPESEALRQRLDDIAQHDPASVAIARDLHAMVAAWIEMGLPIEQFPAAATCADRWGCSLAVADSWRQIAIETLTERGDL